ncbi:MAG: leucine-rich repeat domain-containing protein [Muribaculaceae bacterium]|nr:leucine-rich repeat domain-containing protein [Muribaculaceae bacterium]
MKKLFLMLAATVMTLSAGASIRDTKTVVGQGITVGLEWYTILQDEVTRAFSAEVAGTDYEYTVDVVIPEFISAPDYSSDPIPVEGVGEAAFAYSSVSSITLPNSIRYFGALAFANIPDAPESFNWPTSLEEIGLNAFAGWEWLEELTELPSSLRYLSGFSGLNLTKVVIPEGVTAIGNRAFSWCGSLAEIRFPASLLSIGDEAFSGCGFTSVTLPASLTSLGSDVWPRNRNFAAINVEAGNKNFRSIDGVLFNADGSELLVFPTGNKAETYAVPSGTHTLGARSFQEASNLKNIILPDGLKRIESGAFAWCESLGNITLPESIEYIGESVFPFCYAMTSLHLPASLATMESWPTNEEFESFTVDEGNQHFMAIDGVLYDKPATSMLSFPGSNPATRHEVPVGVEEVTISYAKALESLVLPEGVKKIKLNQNKLLESVNIPSTAVTVHISGTKHLTGLTLPHGVESIYFSGNEALQTVNIPSTVTSLPYQCFSDCPSLTTIVIPASVKAIESCLFLRSKLDKLVIEGSFESYEWMEVLPRWAEMAPAHQVPEGCVVYAHEEEFDAIRQYWTGELRPIGEFDSIDGVEAVADGPVRYFDLHGRSVASPSAGGIYVRTCGGERRVVRF